jgi:hypothetical protein
MLQQKEKRAMAAMHSLKTALRVKTRVKVWWHVLRFVTCTVLVLGKNDLA